MGDLQFMVPAAWASLIMSPVHCLFGLHIVRRGVIFIDLAVAQVAALGAAIALLQGHEPGSPPAYWMSLAFGLFGALLIAITRFRLRTVPHEAIIGIIYVIGSALTVIGLTKTPHGLEEMQNMLVGNVLTVSMEHVKQTAYIYGAIIVVLLGMWTRFSKATEFKGSNQGAGAVVVDFVFYSLLAFVVASSVKLAGVLLVFTWLVMPPVAVLLWMDDLNPAALVAVPFSIIGSLLGLYVSFSMDWPTGAAMVVTFGALVSVCYVLRLLIPSRDPNGLGVDELADTGDG